MNNVESFYPLSPMQQGMLFHSLHAPESAEYYRRVTCVLEGNLDVPSFRKAWQHVTDSHPALRTSFVWEDVKSPVQVVHRAAKPEWWIEDFRSLSPEKRECELQALLASDQERSFDLSRAPLSRFILVRTGESSYHFTWSSHHVILDGWSMAIVFRQALSAYGAFCRNEAAPVQQPRPYRDYISWLHQQPRKKAEEFWRQYMRGFEAATALRVDLRQSGETSPDYQQVAAVLPAESVARLQSFARAQRVTLNSILQGAWSVLLSRYSGQDDVVFGATVAGRPAALPDVESMTGLFMNTLPARVRVDSRAILRDWLRQLQSQQVELREYEHTALTDIQKWSDAPPGTPLFETLLVFENYPASSLAGIEAGVRVVPIDSFERTSMPLAVLAAAGDELKLNFIFDANRWPKKVVERMAGHYCTLLHAIPGHADYPLATLPLLTPAERDEILGGWNDTRRQYEEAPVHEIIERMVARVPDRVAVTFENEQLTYDELNRRANQLAHFLRAQNVGPDVLVAVCMERSIEMVVALLGILKAGGAYVPVDPEYPRERVKFMLEDSDPAIMLTQEHLAGTLPAMRCPIVYLDTEWTKLNSHSSENCASGVALDNLAYTIYTSGSTGRPKGAMNTHRGLCNRLMWMQEAYGLDESDRVLQKTPFSFDVSVWEFFWPLMTGARLVVARPGGHQDPSYLARLIRAQEITTLHFVPSMLQVFLEEPGLDRCTSLKRVICSGEALGSELQARFFACLKCELHNLYGPTEASIDVTFWHCEPSEAGASVPIGRPIANTQIYVLDRDRNPVPIGVPGELHIGGVGLARGYWRRSELTAEKFIADPFSKIAGARLYKSGDLARYRPDGAIEYLGRLDSQIKLRGQRIELGEIETTLTNHAAIKEAAVLLREDVPAEKRIVAYLVAADGSKPAVSDLRSFLAQRLPEVMVPSAFVWLDRMPLSPNGKLDRRALPKPERSQSDAESCYVAPRNRLEERLAQVWSSILKLERVGVHDNFFELGGDSIVAMQTVSRMATAGFSVTTRQLFKNPTIAQLAAVFSAAAAPDASHEVAGALPLTPIQEWFFQHSLANPDHWNQALLLRPKRRLDAQVLRRALAAAARHHDSLRLRFVNRDGVWQQSYDAASEDALAFDAIDISGIPPSQQSSEIEKHAAVLQGSLRLDRGPVARAALFDLGDSQRILLIAHHLVIDGVSWRVLLDDLQTAYAQIASGQEPRFAPKTASFKEWAERLRSFANLPESKERTQYWASQRWSDAAPIPFDSSGANTERSSATLWRMLPADSTTQLLRRANQAYRTQTADLLLTALSQTLSAWTGANAHSVHLEGHGREDLFESVDVSRTTGWFTSLYPVLLKTVTTASQADALKSVKEQLRAIPAGGVFYGVARYLGGSGAAEMAAVPSPEVMFNYLGQFDDTFSDSSLFALADEPIGPLHGLDNDRQHALEINCYVANGEVRIGWTYSTGRHAAGTVAKLADDFMRNLESLIAHCASAPTRGFTPSDFPLARLRQDQLDQIVAANPNLEDIYTLSPMQHGMLFHTLYEPSDEMYFEQLACTLRGALDLDAFAKAWNAVIGRHPALRTVFVWNNVEEPLQIVLSHVPVRFRREQWDATTREQQDAKLAGYLEADRKRPFDLSEPPLMRWALFQTSPNEHRFVWSWSHLLLDGWSLPVILREVFVAYEESIAGRETQPLHATPYHDYISWLRAQKEPEAESFWRKDLKGFTEPTPLAFGAAAGSANRRKEYATERVQLSETSSAAIARFARENHLTLNTLVQGAWALLLSRYSGTRDLVFGATVSGRPEGLPGIDSAVGLFINTLPVRVDVQPGQNLVSWLKRLQDHQLELRQFESTPLVQVQSWSEVPPSSPLFESILVFENYPLEGSSVGGQISVEDLQLFERSNYPLNLVAAPGRQTLLAVVYERGRFDRELVQRLLGHVQNLLSNMPACAAANVAELELLGESERDQLLAAWNDTRTPYPRVPIQEIVEQHAAATPDRVAVVLNDEALTYSQLNGRANQLAHFLVRCGVRRGAMVGLCVERSTAMIVAMLAILKAGAAYVPLDPDYPSERLRFMLADINAPALITQERMAALLPQHDARTICLDRDSAAISAESAENPSVPVAADDLAYVIYTSGSTGKPKGACVPHRAVVRLVKETNYASFSTDEVFLHSAPSSFDAATFEIWGALLNGARVVIASKEAVLVAADFARLLKQNKITTLFLTTALFNQLARENPAIFTGVKQVLFGGERVEPHWVRQVLRHGPPEHLAHVYGPTETTTFATWHPVQEVGDEDVTIPIGRPISNTTLYVLNAQGELVPPGVPGELYIGGDGLAREYLHQPELTAQRFVPHPFIAGERLYRTGDLVRYRDDGAVEFLARVDNQVKIRGFRIEPGEIEAVLSSRSDVKMNVVLAREDTPGEKRLVAYVVPRQRPWPEINDFRTYLKDRLPEYMVPSAFVLMDELPLSPNGKVDRRALPAPEVRLAPSGASFAAPATDLEKKVAVIWQETLGLETVGRDQSFFDLGGHSLLAARITSRIVDALAIELPISAIFEKPTVAELSAVVESLLQAGSTRKAPAISARSREAFRTKQPQVASAAVDSDD